MDRKTGPSKMHFTFYIKIFILWTSVVVFECKEDCQMMFYILQNMTVLFYIVFYIFEIYQSAEIIV